MKKRFPAIILALLMILSLISACGSSSTTNETSTVTQSTVVQPESTQAATNPTADPSGKYDQSVVVNIGRPDQQNAGFPSGDTMESNLRLKYIEERTNIQVKYAWLADPDATQYKQKVSLAIASGSIPDIMYINDQTQLNQLVDAGMVEDLSQAYETTASPYVKDVYNSFGDRKFTTATFDGKLLALPDCQQGSQFSYLWARKDWMDKLGIAAPKSLDDVINLAKAIVQKDPGGNGAGNTVGFTLAVHVGGQYNNYSNMDPIFGLYNAYPRQWIKDASGNYTYGTIAPETKQALAKIHDMYAAGLIDKEFAVRKQDDMNALLVSGKAGLLFGPWWMPDWPLADGVKNNPNADWEPFLAPLDSNGNFNTYKENPHTSWVVVRKGFEHPEALFKILNCSWEAKTADPNSEVANIYKDLGVSWAAWPLPIMVQYEDAIPREYSILNAAVESKDSGKLRPEAKLFYDNIMKYLATPHDMTQWRTYYCRIVGSAVASTPDIVKLTDNAYPGVTSTMETKLANLQKLENETILKIILGEEPVDSFDKFVLDWKAQGGDEITKEVNDQLK